MTESRIPETLISDIQKQVQHVFSVEPIGTNELKFKTPVFSLSLFLNTEYEHTADDIVQLINESTRVNPTERKN